MEHLADADRHRVLKDHHLECAVRSVSGSVSHIEERCCCYLPGSECTDPPEMTKRQAAKAAYLAFQDRYPPVHAHEYRQSLKV